MKGYMWGAISIAVLVGAFSAVSYVRTYSRSVQPSSFRSFSVSAEGKVVGVPDVAEFTFQTITQGGVDLAQLTKQNVQKVNDAIDFVKSKKVDSKDIQTRGYNVEPRYQTSSCGWQGPSVCPPPEIVGYSVTQTVAVKVRDFSVIGELLSGVVESGANSVSQLTFTIDDPVSLESKARAEAIERAQEKARAIAKAGGFSIGRLLSIQEDQYMPYSYPNYSYMGKAVDGMGGGGEVIPPSRVEPGSQDVTARVTLVYEIR